MSFVDRETGEVVTVSKDLLGDAEEVEQVQSFDVIAGTGMEALSRWNIFRRFSQVA